MSIRSQVSYNALGLLALIALFGMADYGLRIDELADAGALSHPPDRTATRIVASAMLVLLPTARILAGRPRAGWTRSVNLLALVLAAGGFVVLVVPAFRSAGLATAIGALRACIIAHLAIALATPVPIRQQHRARVWGGSLAGVTAYMGFAFYASATRSHTFLPTLPMFAFMGLVSYPPFKEFMGFLLADIERARACRHRQA